ncbi:DUF935 family protein [Sinomicrobium kalidii]|uniref:phage portal protein family protein n=1 Tax=Sinomicrobium kalidii TaxID=2900738 RepID=UPI001E4AD341|nr:DUF935 family protein [Sinomicrobium kalidii]UGU15204.1 DUF935 family protein [Sinomicrobium kalidii]
MSIIRSIYRKAESYILSRADERTLSVAAESKRTNALSGQLQYESVNLMAQSLENLKMAVALATDPEEPDFSQLSEVYRNLLIDNHLGSVIDTRLLHAQRAPFKIVDEKGQENEELTDLFQRPWFEDFRRLTVFSRFQGRTLVELYELNDLGELEYIDEIPQGYFNAKKGIILKEPGAQTGWKYKEGLFEPHYLQVGKDRELGMLMQMAPAILAKKLGMGAWQDFIDKYGVPPLFITTDRSDPTRQKELLEAGLNFKRTNVLVGQGNEKFEVGQTGGVSKADTYDLLVLRINSEISKRVLGGTSLTDEKSFVGSAEIQYRLAKDRFESDKLLVKNVINMKLFPKLVHLSPVYGPLQNHYFEWDDENWEAKKEAAEMAVKLAQQFEVDPEWVEQQTGVPILGLKQTTGLKDTKGPTARYLKKKSFRH